jgi:hypothetical protein
MATFYGVDTFCLTDLQRVDVLVTDPALLIGQRLARRLTTPRGALGLISDDPDGGFDVRSLVNMKLTPTTLSTASATIAAEASKDEEVASCSVRMTSAKNSLLITIDVISSAGPFVLTLNVNQLTAALVFSFQAANQ